MGNRKSQTRVGSTGAAEGNINYTYNAAHQLSTVTGQATTFAYDAAGNQTRNGLTGTTSFYGDRLQTISTGTDAQSYMGGGNTSRVTSGGTSFINTPLGTTQEISASGVRQFTYSPKGGAVGFKATERSYFIQDHLGSVVGLFTSTGTFAGGYSYSPYGEARSTGTNAAVTSNPLRYIGGHYEGAGIYKLGARYYDTSLGRFTQMDPSGQGQNPYSYTSGDPINTSDPSGLIEVDFGAMAYGIATTVGCYLAAAGPAGLLCSLIALVTPVLIQQYGEYVAVSLDAAEADFCNILLRESGFDICAML